MRPTCALLLQEPFLVSHCHLVDFLKFILFIFFPPFVLSLCHDVAGLHLHHPTQICAQKKWENETTLTDACSGLNDEQNICQRLSLIAIYDAWVAKSFCVIGRGEINKQMNTVKGAFRFWIVPLSLLLPSCVLFIFC